MHNGGLVGAGLFRCRKTDIVTHQKRRRHQHDAQTQDPGTDGKTDFQIFGVAALAVALGQELDLFAQRIVQHAAYGIHLQASALQTVEQHLLVWLGACGQLDIVDQQGKAIVDQQATTLDAKAAQIGSRQETLEANQKELQTRIEGFKADKELVKADYAAAKATAQIGETVTGIQKDGLSAAKAVGRITEATKELEARGDALSELIQSGALEDAFNPGQSPLDRKALSMARTQAVNLDIERLRKQLGKGTTTKKEKVN